ncbi:MAG: hypothetical protein HFI88_14660 [Lachnospiraceae bacterium]|nr:hypothetical protein [Lachnospiraceae bacterium]
MLKKGLAQKVIGFLLALAFIVTCNSNSILAAGTNNLSADEYNEYGLNVSTEIPSMGTDGISPYGLKRPGKGSPVNIGKNGTLTFHGNAKESTLYTDKCFTGISRVLITVKNKNSSELVVRLYEKETESSGSIRTIKVKANSSSSTKITGLSSKKHYYLSFKAPSWFEGNVKRTTL